MSKDPETKRAWFRSYYQRNKEKYADASREHNHDREYFQKYYQQHKQKYREYGQRHYKANKEKIEQRNHRWRENNPEKYQAAMRKYQEKNHEKIKQRSAQWYAANKTQASATNRKNKLRRYGLTIAQFSEMLESQNGLCAICQKTLKQPSVDHDHKTGMVRGILCRICNAALGQFQESPQILRNAIKYLNNSSSGATSIKSNAA